MKFNNVCDGCGEEKTPLYNYPTFSDLSISRPFRTWLCKECFERKKMTPKQRLMEDLKKNVNKNNSLPKERVESEFLECLIGLRRDPRNCDGRPCDIKIYAQCSKMLTEKSNERRIKEVDLAEELQIMEQRKYGFQVIYCD